MQDQNDNQSRPAKRALPTSDDRLVWIDLEMTGLDPSRHKIVEIAVLITDSELNLIDDGIDLVIHASDTDLAAMDDYVRKMHTRSGLLEQIAVSTLTIEVASKLVMRYIRERVTKPRTAPVCGNSIGMDRRFMAAYLLEIDEYLHYRSIDVSSFKELCRRWYPDEFRGRPGKSESHRALDDIKESIAELVYYRETILK